MSLKVYAQKENPEVLGLENIFQGDKPEREEDYDCVGIFEMHLRERRDSGPRLAAVTANLKVWLEARTDEEGFLLDEFGRRSHLKLIWKKGHG